MKKGFLLFAGAALLSPLALSAAPIVLEDFEFATDDTAAAAGVFITGFPGATGSGVSGTGANANEGTFSFGLDSNFPGTAFEDLRFSRTFAAPISLGASYSPAGPSGSNITDLAVTIDVLGDPSFAGSGGDATTGSNLWILLYETDGDIWRYINFLDSSLSSTSYTNDVRLSGLIDLDAGSTGDGLLTEVSAVDILIQNPVSEAKSGTVYFDDLKIEFIDPSGPSITPLTYTIPLIDASSAPNVTDSVFDSIYSDGGNHQVIAGDDWKDWAQRNSDPTAGISTNSSDPTAAAGIFSDSKAYLVSDGVNLYFGMIVYDPDTSAMTSDSGNDTLTKWNVEDIEVAFSAQGGIAGVGDAFKISQDAFGNIDDMMPDGTVAINTSALTNSNSYVINATTWACEFSVGIDELVNLSQSNLATPLPFNQNWFGHIGYQAPGGRVPLYAAGHGNGFGYFNVVFDFSDLNLVTSAKNWSLYE